LFIYSVSPSEGMAL